MEPRAQRFTIRAVMQYRLIGEDRWYAGTVENMSSTGVLFRGELPLQIDSPIEIAVDVSTNLHERLSSKMVSRGRVVRLSSNESEPGTTMMAAKFSRLRILRD